jgi:type IX secretion system PorP/SprF family membrane protein
MSDGAHYRKSVHHDRQLSFALSAKFFNYGFDDQLYKDITGNDPAMADLSSMLEMNTNVGVYYTSYGFFTGLTCTNLLNTKMPSYESDKEPVLPFNGFYLIGNEFQATESETIEPSLMYKFSSRGEMALDLNCKYMRAVPRDKFSYWVQLTFRQNIDKGNYQTLNLMPMLGFQYNKFHMAYAFDVDMNRLIRYNYGTHEIMLGYTMCYVERFCR